MSNQIFPLKEIDVMERKFTVYGTWENPLFLVKDVAELLEHSNGRMMTKEIDDDEKVVSRIYTLGGMQEATFLTENGLYDTLMLSTKPFAREFKKNVKKVLHELRTTGKYEAYPKDGMLPGTATEITRARVEVVDWIKNNLNVTEACMANLTNHINKGVGLPEVDYTYSRGASLAATTLLKQNGYSMSPEEFNARAEKAGLLQRLKRLSTKTKGKLKSFWCVSPTGLKYGENVTFNKSPNQTQPHWFADTFGELMQILSAQQLD